MSSKCVGQTSVSGTWLPILNNGDEVHQQVVHINHLHKCHVKHQMDDECVRVSE